MPEVTSAMSSKNMRKIHIHRAQLTVLSGPEKGMSWLMEMDVIRIGSANTQDIVLTDPTVSRHHAEIHRGRDGVTLRDLGSTNGTFVGSVRAKEVYLGADTRFRVGRTELLFTPADEIIDVEPSKQDSFEDLVGSSVAMREVFGLLERVAPTELTVLITGETGTGKELASHAVHNRSKRKNSPFVVFDCGAAPDKLIESELFGHQRGAFTGAIQSRPGIFETADHGTIFLDEIGELPLELQPKLLRVLEQREVRRIGASKTKPVDVRVVAATNRNLREQVNAGRFREDLYYRLAVVELALPPLRDRLEDLSLLTNHILQRASHNPGVHEVAPEVMDIFHSYRWPGNVRELKNVIQRALPFSDASRITIDALPEGLKAKRQELSVTHTERILPATPQVQPSTIPFKDAKDELIEAFEREYVIDLLERHDGNVSKAAHSADIDRKSITRLMKKHGITRKDR